MATTQANAYAKHSRTSLAQAWDLLAQGNLCASSEKGWEAASSMTKALAAERGWAHEDVREIYSAVSRMYLGMDDPSFVDMFDAAGELRFNSLEPFFTAEDVEHCLTRVTQFVDKMEALLATE